LWLVPTVGMYVLVFLAFNRGRLLGVPRSSLRRLSGLSARNR
jgi:hypothetical protein